MNTEQQFEKIVNSSLFRLDGGSIDVCQELNLLVECIEAEGETNWYLGEGGECSLDSLIRGAYWAMVVCRGLAWG